MRRGFTLGIVHLAPWHTWKYLWRTRQYFGVFRNGDRNPELHRRWGFYLLGFEIGRR
jgi:hypothetical protein